MIFYRNKKIQEKEIDSIENIPFVNNIENLNKDSCAVHCEESLFRHGAIASRRVKKRIEKKYVGIWIQPGNIYKLTNFYGFCFYWLL